MDEGYVSLPVTERASLNGPGSPDVALTSRRVRLAADHSPSLLLLRRLLVPVWLLFFVVQVVLCGRSVVQRAEGVEAFTGQAVLGGVWLACQSAALLVCLFKLRLSVHLTELLTAYAATWLLFASVYVFLELAAPSSFEFVENFWMDNDQPGTGGMAIVMLYFSMSTQTTVGLGDVSPGSSGLSLLVADVQMLLAVVFHVGLISQALPLFTVTSDAPRPSGESERPRGGVRALGRDVWGSVKRWRVVVRSRRVIRKHLLAVTVLWQALNLVVLEVIRVASPSAERQAVGIAATFQVVQFFMIFVVSYKFVHRDNMQKLSVSFLVQSYLSVVLNFGGLYLLLYLHDTAAPCFIVDCTTDCTFEDLKIGKVLGKLTYLSVTIMSTTGFGDVFPRTWYTRVAVGCQMFTSMFYGVVVLGVAMGRLRQLTETRQMMRSRSSIEPASLDSRTQSLLDVNATWEDALSMSHEA